jgi:hypothetical protein
VILYINHFAIAEKEMAEAEELGLTTEDQLEALDSLENGQEVVVAEGGGGGDVSVVGSNAVDDPVSTLIIWPFT